MPNGKNMKKHICTVWGYVVGCGVHVQCIVNRGNVRLIISGHYCILHTEPQYLSTYNTHSTHNIYSTSHTVHPVNLIVLIPSSDTSCLGKSWEVFDSLCVLSDKMNTIGQRPRADSDLERMSHVQE